MEREAENQDELEELREENKRLREIIADLIQKRIADAVEPAGQSARAEDYILLNVIAPRRGVRCGNADHLERNYDRL